MLLFLITHLGSRPNESISLEDQYEGGFVENPFPYGLGDEELMKLGVMIDLKPMDVNGNDTE